MKEKIIDILKHEALIMETEDYTNYYIDNIDEIAEKIVKLFAIPDVSKSVGNERRELLIAFYEWLCKTHDYIKYDVENNINVFYRESNL